MKIQWRFRLCLFWVKSISGNAFLYLWVFGCARKMHFPEMLFRRPVNGCKLISIFILPSNSHFLENRERAKGEGDAPARRERGRRERGWLVHRSTSNPFDFAVRLRLHADCERSRSTDSSSPIANPDSPSPITISPSRRSQSQSQHRFVFPDREPRFVAPQNRLSSTPKPIVLPLFLLLSIWSDYEFFFLGFICVSELRDEIIYLFGSEKMWEKVRKCVFCVILIFVVVVVWWWCFGGCGFWLLEFAAVGWIAVWKICRKIAFSTIQPNTRKYFSQHFLKYNQTLKNIFLSGK